jgi:hypothetical protein
MSTATARGSSDRRLVSLRAGKKCDLAPKIACQIVDKMMRIKELDTSRSARRAGRKLVVLREAAAEFDEGILHLL